MRRRRRYYKSDQYHTNIYGYWRYSDVIGLACNIEKYDLVYVFAVKDEMAQALNEKGKVIAFHKTHITKNGFIRPSYKYHKTCELGKKSAKFYKASRNKYERHKNDCHKCQMNKFRKLVKKAKVYKFKKIVQMAEEVGRI